MSTLIADPATRAVASCAAEETFRGHEPRGAAGGGSTLEQVVAGVWEDLAARGLAACPVCGGEMQARSSRGVPAQCRTCGSQFA